MKPLWVHAETDIGKEHHTNEDSFRICPTNDDMLLLLVCDGMGGMGHGDQASSMGIEVIGDIIQNTFPVFSSEEQLTDVLGDEETEARAPTEADLDPRGAFNVPMAHFERLQYAIMQADRAIRHGLCSGMGGKLPGCTAAGILIDGPLGYVAWVGDSRVYHIRDNAILSRTQDHKWIEELVASGELTREQAANSGLSSMLTRAVGGELPGGNLLDVSILDQPWVLKPGDRIVVCSDGLIDLVPDEEMPSLIWDKDVKTAAADCIQVALDRGGHDNITVIVAEVPSNDTECPLINEQRSKASPVSSPTVERATAALRRDPEDDQTAPIAPERENWQDYDESTGDESLPIAPPIKRTPSFFAGSIPPVLYLGVIILAGIAIFGLTHSIRVTSEASHQSVTMSH